MNVHQQENVKINYGPSILCSDIRKIELGLYTMTLKNVHIR